jgi:hypothetical protein
MSVRTLAKSRSRIGEIEQSGFVPLQRGAVLDVMRGEIGENIALNGGGEGGERGIIAENLGRWLRQRVGVAGEVVGFFDNFLGWGSGEQGRGESGPDEGQAQGDWKRGA